jgi:tetratricopeptide (TPR) repeat protein
MTALDRALTTETTPRTVIIQLTMHAQREASIELSASPQLPSELARRLEQSFAESRPPRTKLVDYTLRIVANVGPGSTQGESACLPKLWSPHEQRLATLRAASLGERVQLLQKWSQQEVLPVLASVMLAADPDFTGMRSVAGMLKRGEFQVPVSDALDKDASYWRAMLEMAPGNPLLLSSRLFLYVARGELDLARLYLRPIYYFAKTDNLAHDYLEQLRDYVVLFYESVDARIRVGVALHDQARFDDAMALYDGILREYPCSALAIYERWFAKNTRDMRSGSSGSGQGSRRAEATLDEWEQVRTAVFACNPMFEIDAVSRGEQRRQQMLRRLALRELWKERRVEGQDYLRYADIALDLGEYGLAAHLYYLIGTGLPSREYGDRKVLAHFLFSVEQLGVTAIKELFKGDHGHDFAEIREQSETRLRSTGNSSRPGV